jgi:hypothetical protein
MTLPLRIHEVSYANPGPEVTILTNTSVVYPQPLQNKSVLLLSKISDDCIKILPLTSNISILHNLSC